MSQRYHVHYDRQNTTITHHPDGPWPRWQMAQRAAIEHIEEQVAECQRTLCALRRAGSFWEYERLREETASSEDGELAQVVEAGTLT